MAHTSQALIFHSQHLQKLRRNAPAGSAPVTPTGKMTADKSGGSKSTATKRKAAKAELSNHGDDEESPMKKFKQDLDAQ